MNVMMNPMHKETTKVTLNGGENGAHGIHGKRPAAENMKGGVGLGHGHGHGGGGIGRGGRLGPGRLIGVRLIKDD